jgi:CRISPR/Cas system-associated endonuclease Cas1
MMATLYVTEPGARIEKEYRHLLVVKDDETLLRIPLADVSHVVLVGQGVGATTPALHALLAAGVGLSLVRATGELLGRLTAPSGKNLDLRRQQYIRGGEPDFCLAFARQIVLGKLRNYQVLALRWSRSRTDAVTSGDGGQEPGARDQASGARGQEPGVRDQGAGADAGASARSDQDVGQVGNLSDAANPASCVETPAAPVEAQPPGSAPAGSTVAQQLDRLAAAADEARRAGDLATLRGVEGMGSKAYFAVYRTCLRPGFTFAKRTRRPPRDPVNALLSLGYTLLGEAIATALEVVGLDPYEGFYHADKYGRPALALDLVEEFRGPVADSVVLTLINKRMLQPDDFTEPEANGGVYLTRHGLAIFLREFSDRLQATFTHPLAGRPLTYQKCLEVQARQTAKVIMGEEPEYRPLRVR